MAQTAHGIVLHLSLVAPEQVQERVVVVWVVSQHALVGVDLSSDVMEQRVEADANPLSLWKVIKEAEAENPLEALLLQRLACDWVHVMSLNKFIHDFEITVDLLVVIDYNGPQNECADLP